MKHVAVIFGPGFTGSRVARRLLARGVPVYAPVRGVQRFGDLISAGVRVCELTLDDPASMDLPRNAVAVVTIPPLPEPENIKLREAIRRISPSRVIYISSTSVYGSQADVDAATPVEPNDARGRMRVAEELWLASGPWSCLTLRSAAIYGPGRGVHAAVREGKIPRGAGAGVVSRIHVDDLATMVEAGVFSGVQGAWPVADETPCSTDEIVRWCREFLQLKSAAPEIPTVTPTAGRKVEGRKIRELLGVELRYPSWRSGIVASLAEEGID